MDTIDTVFTIILIFVTTMLVCIFANVAGERGAFAKPYQDLVEATCPDTQPLVYIESDKIIKIVYDCSK